MCVSTRDSIYSKSFHASLGEIFNRIITRKKYLCRWDPTLLSKSSFSVILRSRAVQIAINFTSIEEWIEDMELPTGIQNHFYPVRDLLNWLQVNILCPSRPLNSGFQRLSSITEFSDLVETIQTMKNMNPLQVRLFRSFTVKVLTYLRCAEPSAITNTKLTKVA